MEILKITDSLGNVDALPVTTNSSPKKGELHHEVF